MEEDHKSIVTDGKAPIQGFSLYAGLKKFLMLGESLEQDCIFTVTANLRSIC